MYYVYYLESKINIKYKYIGFTSNIKKRLNYHNCGLVKSTKAKKPWKLIYCEIYIEKKDATGREKFLKSGSGLKFLKKQINYYLTKNSHENFSQKETG